MDLKLRILKKLKSRAISLTALGKYFKLKYESLDDALIRISFILDDLIDEGIIRKRQATQGYRRPLDLDVYEICNEEKVTKLLGPLIK